MLTSPAVAGNDGIPTWSKPHSRKARSRTVLNELTTYSLNTLTHVRGLTNVLKASLTHQSVVAMRRTEHTTYSLNTVARNSVNTPACISGLTNVLKCSLPHQGVVTMRITDQLTTPFEVQQAWTNKVPKTSLTHPDRCGNAND
jgi:hypothetical protein